MQIIFDYTLDLIAPVNPTQRAIELKEIEQEEAQALSDLLKEQEKWDSNPESVERQVLCKSI